MKTFADQLDIAYKTWGNVSYMSTKLNKFFNRNLKWLQLENRTERL